MSPPVFSKLAPAWPIFRNLMASYHEPGGEASFRISLRFFQLWPRRFRRARLSRFWLQNFVVTSGPYLIPTPRSDLAKAKLANWQMAATSIFPRAQKLFNKGLAVACCRSISLNPSQHLSILERSFWKRRRPKHHPHAVKRMLNQHPP